MAAEDKYDTLVGTIVGAHGVQGALKVRLASPQGLSVITPAPRPTATAPRPSVTVWRGKSVQDGAFRQIVSAKRPAAKGPVLVKFTDVTDRGAAESLYGQGIFIAASMRAPLGEGEYFVDDLIGISVATDQGDSLGTLTGVIQNPANDVYETDIGALIPAVRAFILEVDLTNKRMTVRNDPGLLPEAASDRRRESST